MKAEVAEKVTQQIIDQLEKGVVPWHKPWTVSGLMPTSGTTNKPYRGINTMLLSVAQEVAGYKTPYWYTFNQARKLGGNVKRGEKGTPVVFWKILEKESTNATTEERETFVLSRTYTVFNADQTENFDVPEVPEVVVEPPKDIMEKVMANYKKGPKVEYRVQSRAAYYPTRDIVVMPPFSAFDNGEAHLSTLFHELVHSTGHTSRLNRIKDTVFGQDDYAEEELVAEIGAAMLLGTNNAESQFQQSAAYIENWLKVLKNDRNMIVKAAQKAQKAVDLINGTVAETEKDED